MKTPILYSTGLLVLLAASGRTAPAASMEQAEAAYRAQVAAIDAASEPDRKKIFSAYFLELAKLYESFRARGQLPEVIAVKKERTRIINDQSLTEGDVVAKPPELKALQIRVLKGLGGVERTELVRKLKVQEAYAATLKKRLDQLILADRITEAVQVRDRMNAIIREREALVAYLKSPTPGSPPPPLRSSHAEFFHIDFNRVEHNAVMDRTGAKVGRVEGPVWKPNGIAGGALKFSNASDVVIIDPRKDVEPDGALTISLWLNIEPTDRVNWNYVLYRGSRNSRQFMFVYNQDRSGEWSFHYPGAEQPNQKFLGRMATPVLPPGEWTHVAVVADPEQKQFRYYENGRLAREGPLPFDAWLKVPRLSLYIGTNAPGRKVASFKGLIDELSIFKRALSKAEIKALHAHPGQFRFP